jgi:6-phosphogluconolactonase
MKKTVRIFSTPENLAAECANEIAKLINGYAENNRIFTVALSGGSTPGLLFTKLGEEYSKTVQWKDVHFFWGDERCVPPDDSESNFGITMSRLLSKIDIPSQNVHRIKGEDEPEKEALRYSDEISRFAESKNGFPSFSLVILGMGEDGHTASIFPGNSELLNSDKICEVAVHPVSGQKRITITGRVINNAESVYFLVTGNKKQSVLEEILNSRPTAKSYPAFFIQPFDGSLSWYIDRDAAGLL